MLQWSSWIFAFFFDVQVRNQLTINLNSLQQDFDNLNARLEEESEGSLTIRNQLSKVQGDYTTLKSKYDKDIMAKTEELEELRCSAM